MALLPYVDPDDPGLSSEVSELLSADAETFGRPSLFARVLAHNPDVLDARMTYADQILTGESVDAELKELVYVAISTANDCEYCLASHTEHLIEEVGMEDSRVTAVSRGDLSSFEATERAVIEFGQQVATDPKRVSENHLDNLREVGFDDTDVVELTVACSAAVAANTIADSLNVLPQDRDAVFSGSTADGTGD